MHKKMKNGTIQKDEVKKLIDIVKAKEAFKEYVKNYDLEDKRIQLKVAHIERTSQMSKKIAENLNLEKEDIKLAELIGLLHDIGRFEQLKRFNTFVDKKSINHGEFGGEILFKEGKIRDFIDTPKYDEIIRKAIINHNRNKIEDGLTEKELLHAKIVRDADKIDIFYILTFDKIETIYGTKELSNQKITDEVYREFIEDKKISYKNNKNEVDIVVSNFAYVYDFNFKFSLKYICDKKYLEIFYKRLTFSDEETMRRYHLIYETAKKYVEDKLGEKDD